MAQLVVILGFDGVQALDVVGPSDVFNHASRLSGGGYEVVLASMHGNPITTDSGLQLATQKLTTPAEVDTLVLPGGPGVETARRDPALLAWIETTSSRARRTVTLSTGAFFAAEAGLLDGCKATTHWSDAARLAQEFSLIEVDPEPTYIRSSDKVWTAAGVTTGIDMSLALVEEDHGAEVAQEVARLLVLQIRRNEGQTQFAPAVWGVPRVDPKPIRRALEAIKSRPAADHSVKSLAKIAGLSPRHFTRTFTEQVGESPASYVERVRVEAARRELEETTHTVVAVASRCGFGTPETLRRAFTRHVGVPPHHYRRSLAKLAVAVTAAVAVSSPAAASASPTASSGLSAGSVVNEAVSSVPQRRVSAVGSSAAGQVSSREVEAP